MAERARDGRRASGGGARDAWLLAGTPLAVPRTALVVPALAALGGLAFFAWKPGVALSAVESPRAFGFTAGVGLLVLLLTWGLPRVGAGPVVTMVAQAVPVTLAFVVTVLPALRVVTVEEAAPPLLPAAGAPAAGGSTEAPVPSDRATEPGGGATEPGGNAAAPGADATDPGGAASDQVAFAAVSEGSLRGIDHDATGRVLLLTAPSGESVVRFEDLDVEPGPDYFVHVVPGADRERPDGGVQLSELRGNRGAQNYDVPAGTALDRPVTVLIWCRAFAVPIAAATLS